ncbi:MAG: DUF2207 domain-containing protein [Candidatus Magasanikbacteria bacterium]|nr:DUF2207 domain-containing protein [Candidatus Magasanikbacteria bacterium]
MKKFLTLTFLLVLIFIPTSTFARRTNPTDWYIENFKTTIDIHPDSSATIAEEIFADAGNLLNKHGIFRVLPSSLNIDGTRIKTPIELISITDFSNNPHPHSTITNKNTITWKIGSANKTVYGENEYKINYSIDNVIRTDNPDFDEFFWNLNGNFWDIETDAFTAMINFPAGVSKNTSEVNLYSGLYGDNTSQIATYTWIDEDSIEVRATRPLGIREGITISVTTPKNIFTPYIIHETVFEKYGGHIGWIIPLIIFLICFKTWRKYGKDPNLNKTIIPEYEAPEKLKPLELGMILQNGKLSHNHIVATIIDLARRGFITIESGEQKKDFTLIKNSSQKADLLEFETTLYNTIFNHNDKFSLSTQSTALTTAITNLQKSMKKNLSEKKIFEPKGFSLQTQMVVIGMLLFFVSIAIAVVIENNPHTIATFFALASSAVLIFIFGLLMSKKTAYGAELEWKGKGFKYFMETAEKYRQRFFENEGLFEELLPYAIMFGMTHKWINAMKNIYGAEFVQNYHPAWFVGSIGSNFSIDSFNTQLDSLTSALATSISPKSGSGGGGSSGGGGGGGGGGGW